MLVGPSPEAEVLTDRVERMIPMIRSSPGGKGWELVYPKTLDGHVTAKGQTRSLLECASDPSARSDGELAVFPLPDGAVGGIELGPLLIRFQEIADDAATVVVPRTTDETTSTAAGIAVVACLLVLVALLFSGRPDATSRGTELASVTASPSATGTAGRFSGTRGAGTAEPDATPIASATDEVPAGTAIPDATPGATSTALVSVSPTPNATSALLATATPTAKSTALASGMSTPTPKATTAAATVSKTPTPKPTAVASGSATPTPKSGSGTPTPKPTALASSATPRSSPSQLPSPSPKPTARPSTTPVDRDPLALAVGTPKVGPKATPTRTPKPSGFLSDDPQALDDEQKRFEDRLGAVPTMTPSKAGFSLDGGEAGVDGSLGSGGTAAGGGSVREGGKGVVGPVDVGPAGSGDVKVASAGKVETPVEAGMSTDAPRVTGTIDPVRVQAVVQEAAGAFRACYESALRRNARISGKVALTWRIVEDGAVEEVTTSGSTLRDTEMERCLITRVRSLRFPRPDGGTVTVEYPMVFYPAVDPT